MNALPFALTPAQQRVISEIEQDMTSVRSMNRLLQGDVGSGKTVVSMAAMIIACENGYQAAIMAPTEILAEQHYRNLKIWSEHLGLKIELLTGSAKDVGKKRSPGRSSWPANIDIVVGTHALIQEGVAFRNLGLVVIDEQHRFGVVQRAMLRKKGLVPDVLVMTATPIPRTLAMTVYGDLDVSVIDEMPPGKKPDPDEGVFRNPEKPRLRDHPPGGAKGTSDLHRLSARRRVGKPGPQGCDAHGGTSAERDLSGLPCRSRSRTDEGSRKGAGHGRHLSGRRFRSLSQPRSSRSASISPRRR